MQSLRQRKSMSEAFLLHLDWKSMGKILCGDVMGIGDIEENEKLEEARKLGASIA